MRAFPLALALCTVVCAAGAPAAVAQSYDDPGVDPGSYADEDPYAGDTEPDPYEDPAAGRTPVPTQPPAIVPLPAPAGRATFVGGNRAVLLRDGTAAIPRAAPKQVRRLIATANRIVGKPYKWGGGHTRIYDRGYDCSGAVSFAMLGAGMILRTGVSGEFSRWGTAGAGRWVTTYSTRNHVYVEVAGLRFDTSAIADPFGGPGPRWRPAIGRRAGFHARHPTGY